VELRNGHQTGSQGSSPRPCWPEAGAADSARSAR
jgi:hypothetical protein